MRLAPIVTALLLSSVVSGASAQPTAKSLDPALIVTNTSYDDLNCAARYTLAAVVIRGLDSTAATYYSERAEEAGKRYLQMHPGESIQSYANRVQQGAQALQERLDNNALTPEGLVADIKHCDSNSDSLIVM
ncbi:MAG TPA: hypothetical protein VGM17_00825 [Rhizomicrobium sp.]|jgi:hypothetical protein